MSDNILIERIKKCTYAIGYVPLQDEADYAPVLSLFNIQPKVINIPQDKNSDSKQTALNCINSCGDSDVCIFVPGRIFDMSGNRKGRGGGWYDRFLSYVPRNWIRVGVCHRKQISKKTLEMHEWDIPVDALLIFDDENLSWEIISVSEWS